MILVKRTDLVAKKIAEFLRATNPFSKTIVFCQNIDHAERMRQALVNLFKDEVLKDTRYVMRITGDENIGKAELDNFIDPDSPYPVIACTSQLMTTGVDAQTCKLIVLDRAINSPALFKQIIGRGTRILEAHNKMFFTIMDFRGVTDLFADPSFDGEPEVIYEPGPDDPPLPPEPPDPGPGGETDPPPDPPAPGTTKYVINDVEVRVVLERVQYYDPDGSLVTESLKEYTCKRMPDDCRTLNGFLNRWTSADRKDELIYELREQGIIFEALEEEVGKGYDPFDLICHIVYDKPPLTRKERAESVKKRNYFTKYGEQARVVLEAILDKYADQGPSSIEAMEILKVQPFRKMGTLTELINVFGGKTEYELAIKELECELYQNVL
jgi:type I restriction enzyme R subunit